MIFCSRFREERAAEENTSAVLQVRLASSPKRNGRRVQSDEVGENDKCMGGTAPITGKVYASQKDKQ